MSDGTERWLPVPEYEGYYEVSDHGRVRSLDRWVEVVRRVGTPFRYLRPGRVLQEIWDKPPLQPHASVRLCVAGIVTKRYIHQLVLMAFVGPRPPGMVACHGPSGPMDNRVSNLRWDTQQENTRDTLRHGNNVFANRTNCPMGHLLAAPNLDPAHARHGHRKCYACDLTRGWANYLGYTREDPEWITEADRRYAEIMHFGKPISYRGRLAGKPRWQPPAA